MEQIRLGQKIGSGASRDCYEVAGNPGLCAKVVRKRRDTRLFRVLGIHSISMRLFSALAFGYRDINQMELAHIEQVPQALKENVVRSRGIMPVEGGDTALVTERVKNYDGSFSETLKKTGRIVDGEFWERMRKLVTVMQREDAQVLDFAAHNIVVQKLSPTVWRPVIVDLKSFRSVPLSRKTLIIKMLFFDKMQMWRNMVLERHYAKMEQEYRYGRKASPELAGAPRAA